MAASATLHTPRTVLVTGGAGFIGSNFLLRVVPRHPAVRWVNFDALTYAGNLTNLRAIESAPNYAFERGDVAEVDTLRRLFETHAFDTVVHFAAESHVDRSIRDPLAFVRTNVIGTVALLDAARHAWDGAFEGKRFYHISTDEVYGSLGADGFFTEDTPYDPHSPYSASKASADHFARAYFDTYGLPVVLSNCSNNYGPFQFPEKLVPVVLLNAVNERPIPVYGKGDNVRDWLYVEDHAEAIETILQRGTPGRTYAVGGDADVDNVSLVQRLCDLADDALDRPAGTSRKLITFVTDRPGHDFRYAIDHSRLTDELGWTPRHTLEDGLQKTVRWYLDHSEWIENVTDASYQAYYEAHYGAQGVVSDE